MESSSYQAELAAAIIAHKFAFDLAKLLCMVQVRFGIEFCYDSLSVGKQAEGTWQAASATVQGHLLRSLHRCIESRFCCPVHHHHVRAHEGEPGNELVDCLAKQAALGEPLKDLEGWLEFVSRRDFVSSAEWWWFLFRNDVHWHGAELLLPAAPLFCPLDGTDITMPTAADNPVPSHNQEIGTMQLCLATCTVLSLMPGKNDMVLHGLNGPSRLDSLLTQLHGAQVGIFAFQETRLRRLSHGHDARYWLFKSSATKHGHYGVMVGLARIIPLGQVIDAQGKPQKIFIQQRDVAVISTDPRHLILRLRTTLCKCILIAGHAPHSGATSEEISQWWSALAG